MPVAPTDPISRFAIQPGWGGELLAESQEAWTAALECVQRIPDEEFRRVPNWMVGALVTWPAKLDHCPYELWTLLSKHLPYVYRLHSKSGRAGVGLRCFELEHLLALVGIMGVPYKASIDPLAGVVTLDLLWSEVQPNG